MKTITLSKGKVALIDDEDFERVNALSWYTGVSNGTFYAATKITERIIGEPVKRKNLLMHRFLIDCPAGMEIDHINGNSLDNRKSNLRAVTKSQNHMNKGKTKRPTTSIYKGVYKPRPNSRWIAYIKFQQKSKNLGYYDTEVEAAHAYDKKALELFGEYARLNFPAGEQKIAV